MYKAKFAFEGQEGEMSLKKDELVELVEKDDNGWWLVRKGAAEGWAPSNYLELVPPKSAAPPPPPPPARRPQPPPPAAGTAAKQAPTPVKSLAANVNAKPVSVFPGMMPANGTAAPWKKAANTVETSNESTPASSRPGSSLATKPPAIANKPKPAPPPVAAKPKPPVPTAPRPVSVAAPPRPGGGMKPSGGAPGQMDLAAAVGHPRYSLVYRSY